MDYVAIHYVTIAGRLYTPGEIFDGSCLTDEKRVRLIQKGAIKQMPAEEPHHKPAVLRALDKLESKKTEKPGSDDAADTGAKADAGKDADAGEDANAEDEDNAVKRPADEDEGYEEVENESPPEIDVMDGVVPPAQSTEAKQAEPPKPAPKKKGPGRKKAPPKPAGK